MAGGAIFGLGLGVHLLVSAWLTLGHHVRLGPAGELAAWWAYDLGANVLSAEASLTIALPGDRRHGAAWSPELAGGETEVDRGEDVVDALGVLLDAASVKQHPRRRRAPHFLRPVRSGPPVRR